MPVIYLKHGTCVDFMLNCSLHRRNILQLSQNVFDAAISHVMVLIVNELKFTPVYFSQKRRFPWTMDTFLHIFDSIIAFLIPFGAWVAKWDMSLDLTNHTSLSPIRRVFAPGFVIYKKGCTRLASARDKVYQLLAHGRWSSPGTPASSTAKTGRHDIAEILLKMALKHQKSKSKSI